MVNEFEISESEYIFSPLDDTDLDPDFSVYSDVSSSSYNSLKRVKRRKKHRRFNNKNSNPSKRNSNLSLPEDNNVLFDTVTIEKQSLQNELIRIPFLNEDSSSKLISKVNDVNDSAKDVSDSASITNTTIISRSSSSGYLSCSDFDESLSFHLREMSSEVDNRNSGNEDVSGNIDSGNDDRDSNNSFNINSSVLAEEGSGSGTHEDDEHESYCEESGEPMLALRESNINYMKLKGIYDHYYFLSKRTIKMLKRLDIEIDWHLPLAHTHPSSFLVYDHSEIAAELEACGTMLRTGKYSDEEDSIIISNWNRFKMTYGFDDPTIFFIGHLPRKLFLDTEKRKFVQYLGYGLNDRTLRCIYNRFEELFGKMLYNSSGRFTVKEEQFVMEINKLPVSLFNSDFNKIKLLQSVLLRKRIPISRKVRRFRKIRSLPEKRIIWTLDKLSKFVSLILNNSPSGNFMLVEKELGYLQWKSIARTLGYGTGEQLKMFWLSRLSVQLTCETPIYRNRLRSDLILRLHEWVDLNAEESSWTKIDWDKISTDLSLPPLFLYKKFRKMAMTYVPMEKLDSVKDSIHHLYDNLLPILQSGKLKDYCLKRLKYTENKELIEID